MGAVASRDVQTAGFSSQQISAIRANMLNVSTHSWEFGTEMEALLELEFPSLSVYGAHPIPPPTNLKPANTPTDALSIIDTFVSVIRVHHFMLFNPFLGS